ncbi:hypothetical protein SeMB42_g07056 [Synchytrium endobioticum]|uniref:Uncharacterized protein n=1 Tax=Synchytrium endobioticum TaxID=286115 RepID=A0A507CR64_9FUNG|nr:hypothetical protein SeMB42_g07056 [Synchytrium endobioticum]TPX41578.1 hypothetical protein SeLEV6574_g06019 [Synchytrium endobioticum]
MIKCIPIFNSVNRWIHGFMDSQWPLTRNEHERIIQGQLEQSNGNVDATAAKWLDIKSRLKKKMKLTHDDRDGSTSGNAAGGTGGVKNDKKYKLKDGVRENLG